jgi:hypothetical protein
MRHHARFGHVLDEHPTLSRVVRALVLALIGAALAAATAMLGTAKAAEIRPDDATRSMQPASASSSPTEDVAWT